MAASSVDQLTAAQAQAAAAAAGLPLEDISSRDKLPSIALFQGAPADYAGAARHAAYWTAIAARALGSRALGIQAGAYAMKATAGMVSFSTAGMPEILNDAAAQIAAALPGATNPQGIALASFAVARLREFASPTAIARAQETDDSITNQLRAALDAMKDAAKTIVIFGGVVGAALFAGIVWFALRKR